MRRDMATTDIRFNRMDKEYLGLRESQGELFEKVDSFEAALLGLTQAVAANHDLIMANRDLIMANRDLIMANREQITEARREIAETNQKLDAMLQHFEVPFKPPTGFIKE